MRGRLKRLQKRARGRLVRIPQRDGGVAEFPQAALPSGFLSNMARLSGEEADPHPLSVAAANSADPNWRGSLYAGPAVVVDEKGEEVGPPEDLSE